MRYKWNENPISGVNSAHHMMYPWWTWPFQYTDFHKMYYNSNNYLKLESVLLKLDSCTLFRRKKMDKSAFRENSLWIWIILAPERWRISWKYSMVMVTTTYPNPKRGKKILSKGLNDIMSLWDVQKMLQSRKSTAL